MHKPDTPQEFENLVRDAMNVPEPTPKVLDTVRKQFVSGQNHPANKQGLQIVSQPNERKSLMRIIRTRPVWATLIAFVILLAVSGVVYANTMGNAWTTNLGKVYLAQQEDRITMTVVGYGSFWHRDIKDPIKGTLHGNEAFFSSENLLGEFTLVFDGDTFKTKIDEEVADSPYFDVQHLSFCGIRSSVTEELPVGCGFSGKWMIPTSEIFPEGGYIVLKQVAGDVEGKFYDGQGNEFDTFSGEMYWGKGWRAIGTTEKHGDVTLDMNAAETGFMFIFTFDEWPETPEDNMLPCAVREGLQSAYLGFFTCKP